MDEKVKDMLMESLIHDDGPKFIITLKRVDLVLDESYFDYDLLKVALNKKDGIVAFFLICAGCRVRNPNKVDAEETPLHVATKLEQEHDYVLLTLLRAGASIYDKNHNGETPLQVAFNDKHYHAVDTLLHSMVSVNLSFNPDNEDDILNFHIAIIRKHTDSIKLYIAQGFDVNSNLSVDSPQFSGVTPLHYLVRENDYGELFEIFLNRSDLSIKNNNGLTPLHSIYYNCDCEFDNEYECYASNFCKITSQLFKHGNDTKFINAVDNSSVSHFHLCCATDRVDCVQVFIDSGVDINSSISLDCPLNAGFTPLHFAVKYSCLQIVELLLKNGADCNRSDEKGATPLHYACTNFETDEARKIIAMLLDYSACPVALDNLGNTPIHIMFHRMWLHDSEEANIFNKLISKVPLKDNLTDPNGLSFLHIICTRNNPDKVEDFLNSGAAIDSCVIYSARFEGYSALHFAVLFNQKSVVEVLLKRNAQVNIENDELHTPLHLSCEFQRSKIFEVYCEYKKASTNNIPLNLDWLSNRNNHMGIIRLLLQYGANIEAKSYYDVTPLFVAFMVEDNAMFYENNFRNIVINEINIRLLEITNILISNNANINYENVQQSSIFHVICNGDLPKISDNLMEYLITAGVDINAVDKDGYTPLHIAAENGTKDMVEIFLKNEANVNIKCKKEETALVKAAEKYISDENLLMKENKRRRAYEFCIKILLENGSDVNVRTSAGRTFLHSAMLSANTFVIKNLLDHGADINIEDSLGNSIVCSFKNDDQIHRASILLILAHVQKLSALGLHVNGKVQMFCNSFFEYWKTLVKGTNYSCNWNVSDKCIDELNRMKVKKIDHYTSLYNILFKDPDELSKHIRNKSFIDILEGKDIDEQFPLYKYLLKLQYKKGLLRSYVLKSAKASIMCVAGLHLPDSCCDSVLKYLTDEEIVNLKKAVLKDKLKRKLNDNDSEMEPLIKFQKTSD